MRVAMARMDAAAHVIATGGAAVDPPRPTEATTAASADDRGQATFGFSSAPVDTTEALIEAMTAGLTYRANAKVMRAGDSMIGALLNMQA